MRLVEERSLLILAVLISFLASLALVINFFIFKFPGNNYFPPGTILIPVVLLLAMLGSYLLQSHSKSSFFQGIKECLYYFLVMSLIAFATNAVQYTPFEPIDKYLIAFERSISIDLINILNWAAQFPKLLVWLHLIYDTLPYQMSCLPILLILRRNPPIAHLREYYFLLLITTLLGFSVYYFYPTLGPASSLASIPPLTESLPLLKNIHFLQAQYDTGIKFKEIHQHISPSTLEGGLIAFPSFHVIWAWLCLYLIRRLTFLFYMLLPVNLSLIIACVLLGWHYPIDLVGSFFLLIIAHSIYYLTNNIYEKIDAKVNLKAPSPNNFDSA